MEELIRKLQEEIATLENEFRVELPKAILTARAHGDLSENAEYHAAKERQGFVNARLNQLKGRLREISMIDVSKIPHDRVGLGSTVVVLDVHKDEQIRYKLVTSEDVNVGQGLISTSSPIGRGLLGKRVGDTVRIQIPDGVRELEIVEFKTIHYVEGS
jgi:transcription elongation factor GreA